MLSHQVRFAADPRAVWTGDESKRSTQQLGWIKVDTDGDGSPDTYLPGTSNFVPGRSATGEKSTVFHDAAADSHEVG